ncbi:MAG: hypothetical protein ACHQ53_15350 [Polyangiales bacterium]
MIIERDKFLSALFAMTLAGAAAGCSSEPAPTAAAPEQTAGAEQPAAAPAAPAEAAAPAPAAEPVPEVKQTGPTHE